jgi:uncharacterized protein
MSANLSFSPTAPDELDRFLQSEAVPDAGLSPAGLDGLLTALVLCPDTVEPELWLPWVWDGDEGTARPAFADEAQEKRLVGLILGHQARIRDLIEAGEFLPRLAVSDSDDGDDTEAAHHWGEGFVLGMTLSPERWDRLLNRHSELVSPMLLLGTPRGRETLAENDSTAAVIDGIPGAVAALHTHFQTHTGVPLRRAEVKVGRNEPCPCGSGKKFKKCCGAGA